MSLENQLYTACSVPEDKEIELVKRLIFAGANVNFVDPKTGETPLHWAINSNNSLIFAELRSAGANSHAKDNLGTSAMDILTRLAKVDIEETKLSNAYQSFEYNKQLLQKASLEYSIDAKIVPQLLMQFDFDINVQEPETLNSLLHWAVETRTIQAIKILINIDSAIVTLTNHEHHTALQLAQKTYNINNDNEDSKCPSSNQQEIIQLLESAAACSSNSDRKQNLTMVQKECAKSFLNSNATVLNLARYDDWIHFGSIEMDLKNCTMLDQLIRNMLGCKNDRVNAALRRYIVFLSDEITNRRLKQNPKLSVDETKAMFLQLYGELWDKWDELLDQLRELPNFTLRDPSEAMHLYDLITCGAQMVVESRKFYQSLSSYKTEFTMNIVKQYVSDSETEVENTSNEFNAFIRKADELFTDVQGSLQAFIDQFKRKVNNAIGKIIGPNCCPWNSKGFSEFLDKYYPDKEIKYLCRSTLSEAADHRLEHKRLGKVWSEKSRLYLNDCKEKFAVELSLVEKSYHFTSKIIAGDPNTEPFALVLKSDVVSSARELYDEILARVSKWLVPEIIVSGNEVMVYTAAANAAKSILKWLRNTDSLVVTRILQLKNELQVINQQQKQNANVNIIDKKSNFEEVKSKEKQISKQLEQDERAATQAKQSEFEKEEKRKQIQVDLSKLRAEENTEWEIKLLDRLRLTNPFARSVLQNILEGSHVVKTRDLLLLVQQLQVPGYEAIHNDCSGCIDNKLSLKFGSIGGCSVHMRHDRDRDDYIDETFLKQFRNIIETVGITTEVVVNAGAYCQTSK